MQQKRDLERKIGYIFSDRGVLEEALTHSSYANENGTGRGNERLEFLGDAVLELCVSEILYSTNESMDEGRLSKTRSRIVKEKTLASWAYGVGLHEVMKLGRGLECQGGRRNPSITADAMEAVLGAVFLDGGYEASLEVVKRLLDRAKTVIGDENREEYLKDSKSALQELLQSEGHKPPAYRLLKRGGPDHAAVYEVEVSSSDGAVLATGQGSSIKMAEFAAASQALASLSQQ